jgi:hypothetical protein
MIDFHFFESLDMEMYGESKLSELTYEIEPAPGEANGVPILSYSDLLISPENLKEPPDHLVKSTAHKRQW